MSEPENLQNERLSDSDPWLKMSAERRANLEKKSECPALLNSSKLRYYTDPRARNRMPPAAALTKSVSRDFHPRFFQWNNFNFSSSNFRKPIMYLLVKNRNHYGLKNLTTWSLFIDTSRIFL